MSNELNAGRQVSAANDNNDLNTSKLVIYLHPLDLCDLQDHCRETGQDLNAFVVLVLMQRLTLYNRARSYFDNGRFLLAEPNT